MEMLETGIIIFLAFWLLWIKLPIITRLKLLGHPFTLDLGITTTVFVMYGGTGAGMLAASAAAVVMSVNISLARYLFGHYRKREGKWYYVIGKLNQTDKIINYKRKQAYDSNQNGG
jgi:hypothetical protein